VSVATRSMEQAGSQRLTRSFGWVGWIAVAVGVLGAVAPLALGQQPFVVTLACRALVAAIVALSLDLLIGNTGLLSFGHAGWYGLGGYVAGLAAKFVSAEMLLLLPFAVIVTAVGAAAIGSILVRQIGKTFAILTLALSQIFYSLVFVTASWTGGEDGLQGIPIATLAGQSVFSPQAWYWLLYAVLVAALISAFWLRRSPLGRAWLALKSNPERARFIGIPVVRLKLLAYVTSAAIAALAGALYTLFNGAVSPDTLSWFECNRGKIPGSCRFWGFPRRD
jgi:branched-chain amino acid transport system permease protein